MRGDKVLSHRSEAAKADPDMLVNLLPLTGSISKAVILERFRDKDIGEKRARGFIDSVLSPNGPIHEWHIKRSGKRDDIHLSRQPQPEPELEIGS